MVAVLRHSRKSSFPIEVKVAPARSSLGGSILSSCSGWDHSVWRPKSARYSHTRDRGASMTRSRFTSKNIATSRSRGLGHRLWFPDAHAADALALDRLDSEAR